jgi:hypothetical protein
MAPEGEEAWFIRTGRTESWPVLYVAAGAYAVAQLVCAPTRV